MAEGCAEWFDPEFAGWIWRFNKEKRRGYEKLLSVQEDKVIYRFKSRHQLRKFIKTL
jgi:hypothetical protein